MRFLSLAACMVSAALLAGCATKPNRVDPSVNALSEPVKRPDDKIKGLSSFAQIEKSKSLAAKSKAKFPKTPESSPLVRPKVGASKGLAGRTLYVNSANDIRLKPGEVILTFDDGPVPKKTKAIMNTLGNYGVKGTFLMVGSMVKSYPSLVKAVKSRGHSIGSHTVDHANLAKVSFSSAKAKIRAGEKALANVGVDAPFFRFPYLASTPALRKWLAQRGVTVLDVDIDSKDYFKDSASTIIQRTMSRVKKQGSGVVLFHDIHARTVAALPGFLRELKAAGFKVVTLKSNSRPSTGNSLEVSSISQ